MKKTIFIIGVLILVTTSSCVTGLQPLVNNSTVITDNRLEGAWEQEGQDYTVQKSFQQQSLQERTNVFDTSRKK